MAYILDTNTFITPKNSYYANDIVPSFWPALLQEFQNNNVKTIDAVATEIKNGNDNLSTWFQKHIVGQKSSSGEDYILPASNMQSVVNCYQIVANLVMTSTQYKQVHKSFFLSGADPWIIAAAKAGGHTVVTFEAMPAANTTKVKIPDICKQMDVPFLNLFDMMRKIEIHI